MFIDLGHRDRKTARATGSGPNIGEEIMRYQRVAVAVVLMCVTGSSMAGLLQTRQVLSFEFPSAVLSHHAPLTPQTMDQTKHVENETLHFSGFDPSLGTLKNAYLSYEGSYAIEYFVKAGTRPPKWNERVVYGGNVVGLAYLDYSFGLTATGINSPITSVLDHGAMTTEAHGPRYSGAYFINIDGSGPKDPSGDTTIDGAYLREPWVTQGNLDTPLLSLANGLDVLNSTVDVLLNKEITLYMAPFFSSFGDPDESFVYSDLNTWLVKVAMTYEYAANGPASIPEPSTLLLACIAFLGFSWRKRRPTGIRLACGDG